ncbi:MAG: thioredoxin [Clostridia bacterium]|nr:thioredoxin [Clostridia bacterium]
MKVFDITGDSYSEEIENYSGTVLIDFFADWCTPCKMITPVIEEVAEKTDVKICKINVDSEKELAKKFGIMSIPTLVVMKNGTIINRSIGITGKKAIMDMIK